MRPCECIAFETSKHFILDKWTYRTLFNNPLPMKGNIQLTYVRLTNDMNNLFEIGVRCVHF